MKKEPKPKTKPNIIANIDKTLITRKQATIFQLNTYEQVNKQFNYLNSEIALLKLVYSEKEPAKAKGYSLQTKTDKITSFFDDEKLQKKIELRIYRLGSLNQRRDYLLLLDRLDQKICHFRSTDLKEFKEDIFKRLGDQAKEVKLYFNSNIFKKYPKAKFLNEIENLPFYQQIEKRLDIESLYFDYLTDELKAWSICRVRQDIIFIPLSEELFFQNKSRTFIDRNRVGF